MNYYLHSWFTTIRYHFVQAFDVSRPLYSRITDFALGIIKAIPIVGHIFIGIEWLISCCRKQAVSQPIFSSDVAKILKVERRVGQDHISRIENQMRGLRKIIYTEHQDRIHGHFKEAPYADMSSSEFLELRSGIDIQEIGKAFSKIRSRITRSYIYAPSLQVDTIAIVGINLINPEEYENFVRLANEVQRLYPNTEITLYLATNFHGTWRQDTSSNREELFSLLGLHSSIDYISEHKCFPAILGPENLKEFELMIGCYGEQSCLTDGQVLQKAIGVSTKETPWVNVMHKLDPICKCEVPLSLNTEEDKDDLYKNLSFLDNHFHTLGIGIGPGESGILLDRQRLHAPLSQGYYCPSYLADLHNEELKILLFSTFLDPEEITKEELRKVSINFGNTSNTASWIHFLRLVACNEKEKHLVVVYNDPSLKKDSLSSEEISILIQELSKEGYGYLNIVSCDICQDSVVQKRLVLHENGNGRSVTVLISRMPESHPDICNLQLASERMLVSSKKGTADAYAAGCKILAFDDSSQPWVLNHNTYAQMMQDQEVSTQEFLCKERLTVRLCNKITKEKNLIFSIDAAIKHALLRFHNPDLFGDERDSLGSSVINALVSYVSNLEVTNYKTSERGVIESKNILLTREDHKVTVFFESFDKLANDVCLLYPEESLFIFKSTGISDDDISIFDEEELSEDKSLKKRPKSF
ncbi:Protein of unknown function (DUF562) [Chlamydia serpentis]|uniref:Uncharacterized protein n=1 Tax=Chlamydia serpentis TaxID=1967782 RepID=A0A2R8FAY0_9CHLA|nr:DUF562 domain-containing protein [Chlamydia serpentis]SPN73588.1 Protein of unknown function (DUF562) [Chlamydia serpentis]